MIKRFIRKFFTRGSPKARKPREPQQYNGHQEGIRHPDISPNAIKVCEELQRAGFAAFIVGGAVRDLLLGVKPKDFDVATNATPEEIKQRFRRAMIIGRRFRLVHVMFGRETIETSTFRALQPDSEKDEHGRVLRDNVFGSQVEDAIRRDFTINALYYDPVSDKIIDYHDGVPDLRAKVLRMIGDPATRYREDPVRMLRVIRFASKLGFSIDEPTRAPISAMADLMGNVPAARLFDEMLKLLTSGHSLECLRQLRQEGLHHGLLPLLDVILEQPAGARFVELALNKTDERTRAGKSISPGFLFATLLWQQVHNRWKSAAARGDHAIPALLGAIDSVLDEQSDKLAIQKRFVSDMREIWSLQPRFERRNGKTPYRLLEHVRLRAAYDFLLLRCDAGELPAEIGDWWTRFIEGDADEREALLNDPKTAAAAGAAPKRRRRRRKPGQGPGTDGTNDTGDSGSNDLLSGTAGAPA